jgi:putative nucleotidyltransferase with HDIG domain
VTGAIVLLGFDAIRNLLLTTSVFEMFINSKKGSKLNQEKYWDHSVGCAVGAKVIGNALRHDKIEELFVSGLLHDIGKILEMMFLPKEFSKVTTYANRKHVLIRVAEEKLLGYTHAEIGEWLAQRWNLPPKLVSIIAHHHQPGTAGQFTLEAAIVHFADILCRALNIGFGGDDKIPQLDAFAWDSLKIKTQAIEPIMQEIKKEFDDISMLIAYSP